MVHDIEVGDHLLVMAKVSQIDEDIILVIPESKIWRKGRSYPDYLGGLPISPKDVLKNYGKTPCSDCRKDLKHIIAVDRKESGTTIIKLEGHKIKETILINIDDPYTLTTYIENLVTIPGKTVILVNNYGGAGEAIKEELEKRGKNCALVVFGKRPLKLESLYTALDIAIRTGELSLMGFYNRFKDGDANIISPDEYLKRFYAEHPQAKVTKKPCKDCP